MEKGYFQGAYLRGDQIDSLCLQNLTRALFDATAWIAVARVGLVRAMTNDLEYHTDRGQPLTSWAGMGADGQYVRSAWAR